MAKETKQDIIDRLTKKISELEDRLAKANKFKDDVEDILNDNLSSGGLSHLLYPTEKLNDVGLLAEIIKLKENRRVSEWMSQKYFELVDHISGIKDSNMSHELRKLNITKNNAT